MVKDINKIFCVIVVILLSAIISSNLLLAQERRAGGDIRETAMQLQRLIIKKQAEGVDISEAMELDRKSREAMRQGRPDECLGLLNQAIALLQEDKQKALTGAKRDLPYEDSPFGIHEIPQYSPYMTDLGVHWVRLSGVSGLVWDADEPEQRRFDWDRIDSIINSFSGRNINLLVTTHGFNSWDQKAQGKQSGLTKYGLPNNLEAYKNYLREAVKRYPQVKYFQIENEPTNTWSDTPENFAKLVKISYLAIKEANPNAKIVLAGAATPEVFYKFYLAVLNELEKIKDSPDSRYFDIVDFHWSAQFGGNYRQHIPLGGNLDDFLRDLRLKLNSFGYQNIPIWITEMTNYDGKPLPEGGYIFVEHSETDQAEQLFKAYVYSIVHNVDKIFWSRIEECHNYGGLGVNSYSDMTGLINNPLNDGQSHKKLAYYTYKKMVEVLEGSDWNNNIQTIKEEQNDAYGIYLYKFIKNGKPIYVGWYDCFDEQKCSRMKIDTRVQVVFDNKVKQIKITEAVPKYESGKEVINYSTAFEAETKSVANEQVTIILKETPVFIEGIAGISTSEYKDSPFGASGAYFRPSFANSLSLKKAIQKISEVEEPYEHLQDIEIKWVRPPFLDLIWKFVQPTNKHLGKGLYEWDFIDKFYGQVPQGINVIASIGLRRGIKSGTWQFINQDYEKKYIKFVKEFVERYDGDGFKDMPGLKNPIKYWQVENEPVLQHIDRKARQSNLDWQSFSHILEITYKAIKERDPAAKVLMGGMATGALVNDINAPFYSHHQKELAFYTSILENFHGKYIDVFDIHYYGRPAGGPTGWGGMRNIYKIICQKLNQNGYQNTEIWFTETGAVSMLGEKEQARDLVKRFVYPLSFGTKKIFWFTMVEIIENPNYSDHLGLVYDGIGKNDLGHGTKKLAYYTYKKMVEILEGSDWDNIETIKESNGIYIYKFTKGGKPTWVAWNDNKEPKVVQFMLDRATKDVKVIEAVPKYESGKDVKDYNAAFKEIRRDIMESYPLQVKFELGDSPVYVQE